ncbi:unnamed protein product, partial [Rotaria magnacalcarata]
EAPVDPFRDEILKKQAELKEHYETFPDIDAVKNHREMRLREILCHILNKLLGNQDETCLFFDSANAINLHDASGNLAEIGSDDKPFVLKLKSSQGLGSDKSKKTDNDDLKLVQTLKTFIERNNYHPIIEDIRDRLAKVHGVDKNAIVIKNLFTGTFNIVYTVKNLVTIVVRKLQKISQNLKAQFDQFVSAKIHPLLYRPSFDISYFDERGNKTFGTVSETHQVGPPGRPKPYSTPVGWPRYGLKVLHRYKNDAWLHPFVDAGNWYRAFHGTESAQNVDFGEYKAFSDQNVACVDALANIFQNGFRTARNAAYGPGVYCSPNPCWLGSSPYVGAVEIETKQGKKKFKCMFQLAVNPDGLKCATEDIWVVPKPQDIRPYGILIEEA